MDRKTFFITFSPTRTSYKVGKAIAEGIGGKVDIIDLTYSERENITIPSDATVVFAFPVYGGHIAPVAVKRLQDISSVGAPAVAVAVYGNRDYESALCELGDLLHSKGFKVIAGATFVGEHSYSSAKYPIAAGRPCADDLKKAEDFGRSVRRKISEAAVKDALPGEVDLKAIPRPKSGFMSKVRFIAGVIKIRTSKAPRQMTPETDTSKCTGCGVCIKACPTGAISKDLSTEAEKCIRCNACVKKCSRKARTYSTPFAPLLSRNFSSPKKNMTIL